MAAKDERDINKIVDIWSHEPKSAEIWYGHSILTAILFPYTARQAEEGYTEQRIGDFEYILEAGLDLENKDRVLPFGKYPRLVMAWMAKRIRLAGENGDEYVDPERCVITIPNLSWLAKELGLSKGSVVLRDLNEHIKRMTQSIITIHRRSGFIGKQTRHDVLRVPFATATSYSESEDTGDNSISIALNPEVFRELANETAPFDMRASSYLLSGRSVMAYDIYIWLVGSFHNLRRPMPFPWEWLHQRFGSSIKDERNFRMKFRKALERVQKVYPAANVTVGPKGCTLHPSPEAIPPRQKR